MKTMEIAQSKEFLKARFCFKKCEAFTLLEIMLVVVIIGMLVTLALGKFSGTGERARIDTTKAMIAGTLRTALGLYEMENGSFPTTEQGLKALMEKPTSEPIPKAWHSYLESKTPPKDPWNHDYIYIYPGTHNTDGYDLYSLGKDGVESEDDIRNW